jgi:hypothetical protein
MAARVQQTGGDNVGGGASTMRSTLVARRYWMPDRECTACTNCGLPFSLFRRKHHCRFCGKIFCQPCSSQTLDGRAFGIEGHVRVCDDCKRLATSVGTAAGQAQAQAGTSGSYPHLRDGVMQASGAEEGREGRMGSDTVAAARALDASGMDDGGQGGGTGGSADGSSAAVHGGAGGAGGDAPTGAGAHSRADAAAAAAAAGRSAAAALVDKEFANGGGGIGVFDDKHRLWPPAAPQFNRPATPESESLLVSLCGVADAHLEWVVRRAVSLYFPELAPAEGAPEAGARRGGAGAQAGNGLPSTLAASAVDASSLRLSAAQGAWADALLRVTRRAVATIDPHVRLGDRADVRLYVKIKAVADPACMDAATSAAGSAGGGSSGYLSATASSAADVEGSASSVPRVGKCEVIHGVMFRKNLPHKSMRQDVQSPRVLVLDDALQFEGGVNARLTSLDTLIEQERKYTDILVSKILALGPDLLFVSRNVSRLAQEMLLRGSVSVVSQLKPSILHRVSRCTGARILPSINYLDKMAPGDIVGTTAGRFVMRTLAVPLDRFSPLAASRHGGAAGSGSMLVAATPRSDPRSSPGSGAFSRLAQADASTAATGAPGAAPGISKRSRATYVVLEGCPPHLGCTILLRGHRGDLARAKTILRVRGAPSAVR